MSKYVTSIFSGETVLSLFGTSIHKSFSYFKGNTSKLQKSSGKSVPHPTSLIARPRRVAAVLHGGIVVRVELITATTSTHLRFKLEHKLFLQKHPQVFQVMPMPVRAIHACWFQATASS